MTDEQHLFRGAHEALTFAYRYVHGQSPRTPMSGLMQRTDGGGSGRGLGGLDGAGQAGMILAIVGRLRDEQQRLLMVRYGDTRQVCQCCGCEAPTKAWRDAVDALSHDAGMGDLARHIRHAAIEKIVCRRGGSMRQHASAHGMPSSVLHRRWDDARKALTAIEKSAMQAMTDHLEGRGLLERTPAEEGATE